MTVIGPTVGGLDAIAFIITPSAGANQPPVIAPIGDHTVDEGALFSQAGSFVDPDVGDLWTATVDYGDGSGVQALALSGTTFQLSHVFADDGAYPVTVKVMDNEGGVGTDRGNVTVRNVPPLLTELKATTIDENGTTTLVGTIVDPGTLDTFILDLNWGDPLSPKNVEQYAFPAGTTDFILTHQYLDDNPSGTPLQDRRLLLHRIPGDPFEGADAGDWRPLLVKPDTVLAHVVPPRRQSESGAA